MARAAGRKDVESSRARRERVRWIALLALVLLAAAPFSCMATVPACAGAVRTARLMPAFFAGLPVDPSGWGAPAIVSDTEPLDGPDGGGVLHIWRPASGRYPALVVSLGADPAPPDDPRVVRLFRGLARAGLVAVLVQSPALDADRITPAAPVLLVNAVQQVANRPDVRDGRVGLAGFSVGGALAQIAAADPSIRDRLALVESFGGYARMADMAVAVTTERITYGDRSESWVPDALAARVVRFNLIEAVDDLGDRAQLLRAFVDGDGSEPLSPSTLNSPQGRLMLAVLANRDPAAAPDLIARLPAVQLDTWEKLSPLGSLAGVRAPVFLMHDRADPLIPYVESRRARDALAAAGHAPYYSEFDIFQHVDPTRGGSPRILARDLTRLLVHIYSVLKRLE